MKHTPSPRNTNDMLPIVILISGKSGVGKSTLSHFLNKSDNIKYFSLDTFTVDTNIPIDTLKLAVNQLGENAVLHIPKLEQHVMRNMDIFIEYCYDSICKLNYDIFIFDGIYFNNISFLNSFKAKFNKKYKVWLITPQ
jgi:adenylate kinase family enzyme